MRCLLRFHRACCAAVLLALTALPARAQVGGNSRPNSDGPLSDISGTLSDDSGPIHSPGGSLRENSPGRLGGNSVRSSTTGTLRSGPVSDLSLGAVTAPPLQPLPIVPIPSTQEGAYDAGYRESLVPLQQQLEAVQPLPREGGGETQDQEEDSASSDVSVDEKQEEPPPEEEAVPDAEEATPEAEPVPTEAGGETSATPEFDVIPNPEDEAPTPGAEIQP